MDAVVLMSSTYIVLSVANGEKIGVDEQTSSVARIRRLCGNKNEISKH